MKHLRWFGRIFYETLREISDERAYECYLTIHRRRHSGEQWRRFSDERLRAKYVRPKCC